MLNRLGSWNWCPKATGAAFRSVWKMWAQQLQLCTAWISSWKRESFYRDLGWYGYVSKIECTNFWWYIMIFPWKLPLRHSSRRGPTRLHFARGVWCKGNKQIKKNSFWRHPQPWIGTALVPCHAQGSLCFFMCIYIYIYYIYICIIYYIYIYYIIYILYSYVIS